MRSEHGSDRSDINSSVLTEPDLLQLRRRKVMLTNSLPMNAISSALCSGRPRPRRIRPDGRKKKSVILDDASVPKQLSSQGAISLENARLYAKLSDEKRNRRKAEDDLRRSEAALAEAQQISHTGSWRWKVGTDEVSWSAELFQSLHSIRQQRRRPMRHSWSDSRRRSALVRASYPAGRARKKPVPT